MSNQLEYNLTSGSSYLTQNSENPERDGQIIFDNLNAIAQTLFGVEYTDDEMEIVISKLGSGLIDDAYDADCDADEMAKRIDKSAKRNGGTGWL